jgi:hypothetical protein
MQPNKPDRLADSFSILLKGVGILKRELRHDNENKTFNAESIR